MSIWADMHRRSNGTSIRKEDKVIPEKPQENCMHGRPLSYDYGSKIYKTYTCDFGSKIYKTSDLDDMLDNLKKDYYFFY